MAEGGKQTPPKDFVCPITSHIFVDPVTLETGQTYERRAIQEWLERGNSTCPITRQKLQSSQLPKTNYVLKRLIAGWKEQNPGSKWSQTENPPPSPATNSNSTKPSSSPTSVITQASMDGTLGQLRLAISNLCTSDALEESEKAVPRIEQFWKEASSVVPEIQALLSKPAVINGFVEILFNSIDTRILRATVFLLSELASRESTVIQTLTRVESDIECVVALFKKGLIEAVVLIYLLGPSHEQLLEMDMVEALLKVVKKQEEDMVGMCVKPRTVAVVLLGQIMRGIDEESVSKATRAVISEQAIESIVACLEAESVQERIAAVGVLLRCLEEEGSCRRAIAEKVEVTPVLESFVGANDGERFEIVAFLSELVKQNK